MVHVEPFPSWESWELSYYVRDKILFSFEYKYFMKIMLILKAFPKIPNLGTVRHLPHSAIVI